MILFEWTSDLELGLPLIDNQHKKLVDMINTLYELSINSKSSDPKLEDSDLTLESVFVKLFDYTNYHFQIEEKLFAELNYENTETHKMAHDSLRSKLSDFYKNFAKYESNDTEILEFLTQWLKEHILVTDRKYVDLFIAKKPELTKAE